MRGLIVQFPILLFSDQLLSWILKHAATSPFQHGVHYMN